MRGNLSRLAGLVPVLLALAGTTAFGQNQAGAGSYAPPTTDLQSAFDPSGQGGQLPIPVGFYGNHPEQGGFFFGAGFVMMRQTNPLRNQTIAYRGFTDTDGSITGQPGTFIGSRAEALNARNVSGPGTYQPGTRIDIGWRFSGEAEAPALTFSWMYFLESKFNAQASEANKFFQSQPSLADTFLSSPVYAFPNDYAGPANKVAAGSQLAAFGIWNGASLMTLQFTQKLQQWDLTWRQPYYSNENYRISGLFGGRFLWIWENFLWKTFDLDALGNTAPLFTGVYSNIVSNRMYGPSIGCSQEWYLGRGLAANLDLGTAALLDVVKERIRYEFGDRTASPQSKLGRTDYTMAVQFTANAGLTWYATEGIQLRFGYDFWWLLNSVAAAQPVNFNWGSPAYQYSNVSRIFDGFTAMVGLTF